ncbi:MAG TPA: response regulator [Nitrososphaeraceae archaeon]|nr:response regulator [Nitrososphaeraceae archaeon]
MITNKLFILNLLDAIYKLRRYKTMITSNDKSIVVVDDERHIVNQIKRSLEAMDGLKVYTFTDPFAALEHFNSGCKDHHIVISDIRMPGMNGYEFVKQVKKIDPQVKIILMSSFEIDDNNLLDVLPDVKIDTFLQKPFSLDILTNIVAIPR